MPSGKHKSRTYRRVFVKTPGHNLVMHYRRRRPAKPVCAVCKEEIQGVVRERPFKVRNTSKSKKRPTRPFGGNLCSKCMRIVMKERARQND